MHKTIKLLLINAQNPKVSSIHPPLNLLMLAEYLIKKKILAEKNIKVIDTLHGNPTRIASVFKPDLTGFSVMTPSYPYALKIAKAIKQECDSFLIIGGYHISGLPRSLEYPFDIGVIGEGEGPLLDIVRLLNQKKILNEEILSSIKNIVFRNHEGNIIVNRMRPLLKPKEIPNVRWSMLSGEEIYRYAAIIKKNKYVVAKSANIFTARGCPYKCKFCAAQIMWPHKYGFRMFPISRVGKEMSFLFHKYGVDSIHIWDDTFTVTKKRLRELINELKRRHLLGRITFDRIYVRADRIDEEFAKLLKEFNTISVYIGFESGSGRILSYLKNQSLSIRGIRKAVKLLQKEDIYVTGSIMLFSPNETVNDLQKSYGLAKWLVKQKNMKSLRIVVTCPFPGTDLWNKAIREGVINKTKINWEDFIIMSLTSNRLTKVFFTNGLSPVTHKKYWDRFQALSNKVTKKRKRIDGWKEAKKKRDVLNNQIDTRIKKKKAFKEIEIRIIRFLNNPVKSILMLKSKPQIIGYILRDFRHLLP